MKLSLRWRVTGLILLCLAPIVALSTAAVVGVAREQLWQELELDAVSFADTVRRATRRSMLAFDRGQIGAILDAVSRQKGIRFVRLYDASGHFRLPELPDSSATPRLDLGGPSCTKCHPDPRNGSLAEGYCSHRQAQGFFLYYPIHNEPDCSGAACHRNTDTLLGVLEVGLDNQRLHVKTHALFTSATLWGLIVLAGAALPLLIAFRWLVGKPFRECLRLVREVALGHLAARSRMSRRDEWGELLRAFDGMAAGLEDARAELEALNRDLEGQVEGRTRELAVALDAARESDRMKTEFLAGISHELSTPLQGVIGYAELLLDGIEGELSPVQRHDVEVILRNGFHLLGLVEDLLELARIEGTRRVLCADLIRVEDVVLSVVEAAKRLASGKPVEIVVEIEPGCPPVFGDSRAIHQVLFHLVENAVRHTAEGSVTVSLRRNGDRWLEVGVTDTGSGADPEMIRLALRGLAPKDGGGGLGVGLSLARRLVELHGGELRVESAPGKGTHARFSLPVNPGDLPESPEASDAAGAVPPSRFSRGASPPVPRGPPDPV